MKLAIAGATGFVGAEVLSQCLKSSSVDSMVVFSRRPLPQETTSNPKLKVLVLHDFLTYPENVIKELAGTEGCIW